jgi:hypothetical protein
VKGRRREKNGAAATNTRPKRGNNVKRFHENNEMKLKIIAV